MEKLKIDKGKKVQELVSSLSKSFTEQANKEGMRAHGISLYRVLSEQFLITKFCFIHKEERKKISVVELECEQLRAQLQRQIEANRKAQEEILYLKEQVMF